MWALNFMVIWFSISIVTVATGWYAANVIAPRWPEWWRRVVVDVDPVDQARRKAIWY